MLNMLRLLPMESTDVLLPIDSTDPKLPTLSIDAALATLSRLAQLNTDHLLTELSTDPRSERVCALPDIDAVRFVRMAWHPDVRLRRLSHQQFSAKRDVDVAES